MTTIKFFYHSCQTFRPVEIEPVAADDLNSEPWGDIVCGACHFVIATISGPAGVYQIVRVDDIDAQDAADALAARDDGGRTEWAEYVAGRGDVLERGMPKR